MTRRLKLPVAAVLACIAAGASAGLAFSDSASRPADPSVPTASAAPDSSPDDGPTSLLATDATTPLGSVGVLAYHNAEGQACFAVGRPERGTILARHGTSQVPLDLVGHCADRPEPLAYQFDVTPEGVVLYGLAADDVKGLTLRLSERSAAVQPTADHAFVVSIVATGLSGKPSVEVTKADGSTQTLMLPPLLDFEEINRTMRENAKKKLAEEAAANGN